MYMVLIFDGDEGGAHNTWAYLHVTDWDDPDGRGVVAQPEESTGQTPATGSPAEQLAGPDESSLSWPLLLGIGIGGLVLGAGLGGAAARRRT
jgi:hypothetical protein